MDEDEVVGCLLSNEAPSSISSTATNNNKIPKATKTTITYLSKIGIGFP
jgi:hypothetical protein